MKLISIIFVCFFILTWGEYVFGNLSYKVTNTQNEKFKNRGTEWQNLFRSKRSNDNVLRQSRSSIGEPVAISLSTTTTQSLPKFSTLTLKEKINLRFKRFKNLINQKIIQSQPAADVDAKESVQDVCGKSENEICFPMVGCFSMGKPWKSALRPICGPDSPESISTSILFYSRAQAQNPTIVTLYPNISLNGATFDSSKKSVIIVHGFASSANESWVKDMKDAYLKHVDANVMLVNWEKGSNLINYLKVAGNTRLVGRQMGMFVMHLIQNYGADPKRFHIIGHSLGAQICSYLAKDVPGIGRLTALDPAQPGFEGFEKTVRLDKSDADFVDVIHTSAKPLIPTLGFGMIAPHGHVDFYMNGGYNQPGCYILPKEELPVINNILDLAKFPVEALSRVINCAHGRSYAFLIEAFNETEKCTFWGHKADVTNVLQGVTNTVTQGLLKKLVALSPTCTSENCVPLGFNTQNTTLNGSFVITTSGKKPFCISESGLSRKKKFASLFHSNSKRSLKKK